MVGNTSVSKVIKPGNLSRYAFALVPVSVPQAKPRLAHSQVLSARFSRQGLAAQTQQYITLIWKLSKYFVVPFNTIFETFQWPLDETLVTYGVPP